MSVDMVETPDRPLRTPLNSGRTLRSSAMPRRRLALLGALWLAAAACASPVGAVRVDPAVAQRQLARSAITTGEPSWPTRNMLFEHGLFEAFDERPEAAIAELHRAMVASRGGPGPPLRPGRAVLPPRTGGQEPDLSPGGGRLCLRLPVPRGIRGDRRAVRPASQDRGGSLQLGAHRRLRVEGPLGGRPAGRHVHPALRTHRGGLRSGQPARRGPRAVPVHPDGGAGGARSRDALPLAGPRRSRSPPPPDPSIPRDPAGTWWRRASRCR